MDEAPVDETLSGRRWLGLVVPKRHARRAVTRSLLKRQMRVAVQRESGMAGGMWVLRLCSPFDRGQFPSAASPALRGAARDELTVLMDRALRPGARRRSPAP